MNSTSIALSLGLGLLSSASSLAFAADLNTKVFSVNAAGQDRYYDLAFAADGSYYAVGSTAASIATDADSSFLISKFGPNGELDTSFGNGGHVIHNVIAAATGEVARGIVVEDDGKIVVAGPVEVAGATDARDRDIALIRLNDDGSLDSTFGTAGTQILNLGESAVVGTSYITDAFGGLTRDSQGRLILNGAQKRPGGNDSDFVLARLNTDGSFDSSFGTDGKLVLDINNYNASARSPVALPDGHILGTGYQNTGSVVVPVIYKVDVDGQLDTTFGVGGIFQEPVLAAATEVYSAVLQGSSLVTVGYGRNNASESLDFVSIRVTADGHLDKTYGEGGNVRVDADGFNDNGRNMTMLPDGRIMLIGGGRYSAAASEGMIAILTPEGKLDETFNETGFQLIDFGGENDFLWGVKVSPAGDKVVAVGIKGTASGDDAVVVTMPLTR